MATKERDKIVEGPTGQQHVPPDQPLDAAPVDTAGGPMPMGMTGKPPADGMHPDPDQKSTHVKPKTVEGVLPDGSPKYMDHDAEGAPKKRGARRATTAKAGTYRVTGPSTVRAPTGYNEDGTVSGSKYFAPGEELELSAEDAASLEGHIEPVK